MKTHSKDRCRQLKPVLAWARNSTYKQLCDNITELFQQAIEMDVDDLSNRVKSSVNEKIGLSRSTDDEKARLRKVIEWAHVYIARLKEGKEPDYDRIRVGGKFYGTKNEDVARELVRIAKKLMAGTWGLDVISDKDLPKFSKALSKFNKEHGSDSYFSEARELFRLPSKLKSGVRKTDLTHYIHDLIKTTKRNVKRGVGKGGAWSLNESEYEKIIKDMETIAKVLYSELAEIRNF